MEHKFRAVEDGILEVVGELDGIEVARVYTKLAEHAVAEVILIIVKNLPLAAGLGVSLHVGGYLNSVVRTCSLTHCASCALVVTDLQTTFLYLRVVEIVFGNTLKDQTPTMAFGDMKCRLTVFRILLGSLRSEILLHRYLQSGGERL